MAVRTSVVIPAYAAWRTLPTVLDALAPRVVQPNREVIVVDSSGGPAPFDLQAGRPWLQVVRLPDRALPGAARNVGVGLARGDRLAFLDADSGA